MNDSWIIHGCGATNDFDITTSTVYFNEGSVSGEKVLRSDVRMTHGTGGSIVGNLRLLC